MIYQKQSWSTVLDAYCTLYRMCNVGVSSNNLKQWSWETNRDRNKIGNFTSKTTYDHVLYDYPYSMSTGGGARLLWPTFGSRLIRSETSTREKKLSEYLSLTCSSFPCLLVYPNCSPPPHITVSQHSGISALSYGRLSFHTDL